MTIRRWHAIIIFALTFLAGVLTASLVDSGCDVALRHSADMCTETRLMHANIARSFEHCIGAQQERFRNREAHDLRSLQVDGQLELRGLLYRQLVRLPALQYPLHKLGAVPKQGGAVRAI